MKENIKNNLLQNETAGKSGLPYIWEKEIGKILEAKKNRIKNNTSQYDTNFTAGGILFNEFRALQPFLNNENFEGLLEEEKLQNKYVQIPTESSRKRILAEMRKRYVAVNENFWSEYLGWKEEEQKLALFYLCLKVYPLVLDLHLEVAVKKYKTGAPLDAYDIQMRFEEIMSYDEKVSGWSQKTFDKLNIQYRKALADAGLLTTDKMLIKPGRISPAFWQYFVSSGESWFLESCFIR